MNNISEFRKNRILKGEIIVATPTRSKLNRGTNDTSTTNAMLSAVLWMIMLLGGTGIVWVVVSYIRSLVG